jgi:hypothetical protein
MDMDEHVEKMVKQFAMTNASPSTCFRMLHRMDDRLYDVQTVSNIFNKAKKSLLEEKGVDTSSTKAQQLIDFLMTNPNTNSVIVIHDPSSSLIGKRKNGRPNKKRENHLVLMMKMSNKEATAEEVVIYGINVIRNIQQVTTDGDRQIYNPLVILSRDESSRYGVKHMVCTFHLVEQKFDNDVLYKEDREGIVYQAKNWIHSFTNYCESENEYKLLYKLLIEFMNRPDIFESMGPNKYILSTWIKKKDKLLYYK